MPQRLSAVLALLILAAGLSGCHTTRMGQSIGFPSPEQRQAE